MTRKSQLAKSHLFAMVLLIAIAFTFRSYAQVQPDTWYRLENGQNKKSIANNGANNVGAVMKVKSTVQEGGHWKFVAQGGGLYRIQNKNSGMYLANFGANNDGAELKQTNSPGGGALWKLKPMQGGYVQIVNNESNMYVSLGGQEDNASLIQTNRMSGQTTWLPVSVGAGGTPQPAVSSNSTWVETPLPNKYYGKWNIFSRVSSRNDVVINGTSIVDGLVDMRIVKCYTKDGVYKVVTTLNNYYQAHFIKDRVGGVGDGGIYINSTNSHAYRSMAEAVNLTEESQRMDSGYR